MRATHGNSFRRFVSANVLVRSSLQALAEQREGHEQLFADMDQILGTKDPARGLTQ